MNAMCTHYNSISRQINFAALVTSFCEKYLPIDRGVDDLPTKKWPETKPIKGKKKNAPVDYTEIVKTDYWTCYKLSPLNGLETWSYVKKVNEIPSFYSLENKNEEIPQENRVNYLNTTHKGLESPAFKQSWNASWKKTESTEQGVANVIRDMPKDIWFSENCETSDIFSRYSIARKLRDAIPHAICYTCSGRSNMGYAVYRYYPTLQALVEHSRTHEGGLSKFSCFNLNLKKEDWVLVRVSLKPLTYHLMRRSSVERVLSRKRGQKVIDFRDNMKGGWMKPTDADCKPSFTIYGWNARSLFKYENAYSVEKFLTEKNPDFLLINESGKFKKNIEKVVPNYKSVHCGDKVLAYHRRDVSATPFWREMWQGHMVILKVTLNKRSMLLLNVYRPPSDDDATTRITAVVDALDRRYESTPIVLFGDLNYRRNELQSRFPLLYRRNFKFIFDPSESQFTRSLDTVNGLQKSYLDYFVVKNVKKLTFSIHEPLGNSDHRAIRLELRDEEMRIKRCDLRVFSFNRIWKDCVDISEKLLDSVKRNDPVAGIADLVTELGKKYPPRAMKVKSHFKVVERLKGMKDWEAIRRLLKSCSTENFLQFLACFETLKATRRDKEYFVRLRFYSELNKNTDTLSDLVINDPVWGKIVTTDKETMNAEIASKYKELFKDKAGKVSLPLLDNTVIYYTDELVTEALKRLDLSKAISWDLIPGKSFNIFKKPENIKFLTSALNKIICAETIPDEIALGRLFCLNKNALEPGTIDGIRPIVILGVLVKLLEYPLLKVLKRVKLSTSQIGFKERMGTEVNIIRLRQVVHNLRYRNYDRKSKMKKRYLLFVDLKTAFDSVNLKRLIVKLRKKGVPIPVINSLIKLMNSSKISTDRKNIIAINSGVAQGKLCSPILFNIYIDDLVEDMNKICYCALAFADDTVFVCESLQQLYTVIAALEEWCLENEIELNKKKSGILIIDDDGKDGDIIKGFPVVTKYKYLGVMLDTKISPKYHITAVKNKLKTYLQRNRMLHKKYFSPYSLIRIVDYFVKSRISYGLCCFLDSPSTMKKLENVLAVHLKGIFGLPVNTSHRRILATLGEPEIKMRLAVRLLKNWHKYKENFGEFPKLYEETLLKYFDVAHLYPKKAGDVDFTELRNGLINNNIRESAKEFLPVDIRDNHRDFLKKNIFSWTDMRNWHVIRYFTSTTKGTSTRLFPKCSCGADNSPDHGADHCPLTLKNRDKILRSFRYWFGAGGLPQRNSIYEYLHAVYFSIPGTVGKATTELVELMKKTITQIILNDESICGLLAETRTGENELLDEKEKLEDSWTENVDILSKTMDLDETVLTAAGSELESELELSSCAAQPQQEAKLFN